MAFAACGKDGFPLFPPGLSSDDAAVVHPMKEEWTRLTKAIENRNEGAQRRARTEATRQSHREKHAALSAEKNTLSRHRNLTDTWGGDGT